jgi:hypothetical protein
MFSLKWVKGTNFESPHYVIFSVLLLVPLLDQDPAHYEPPFNVLSFRMEDEVSHPRKTIDKFFLLWKSASVHLPLDSVGG